MAPPNRHHVPPEERPISIVDSTDSVHVQVGVSLDEVNSRTGDLFSTFISHHLERDGHAIPQNLANRRLESAAAREIIRIGDQVNNDVVLNNCISQLHVDANTAYETFACVACQIFQDGVINWGRIVMLFIFGYKLALRVVECKSTLLYVIMQWVTKFVMDKLSHWIVTQGGWGAVTRRYGASARQTAGVVALAGLILAYLYWKK